MRFSAIALVLAGGCGLVLEADPQPSEGGLTEAGLDGGGADARMDGGPLADAPPLLDAMGADAAEDANDDVGETDGGTVPGACARMPMPSSAEPLSSTDVVAISLCGAPSLAAQRFRCKSYTFCSDDQTCIYYDDLNQLGHYQSSDDYYDGPALPAPAPLSFRMAVGADSTCRNPPVDIGPGEFVRVTIASGVPIDVQLPVGTHTDFRIFINRDGRTFWDRGRTTPTR